MLVFRQPIHPTCHNLPQNTGREINFGICSANCVHVPFRKIIFPVSDNITYPSSEIIISTRQDIIRIEPAGLGKRPRYAIPFVRISVL